MQENPLVFQTVKNGVYARCEIGEQIRNAGGMRLSEKTALSKEWYIYAGGAYTLA